MADLDLNVATERISDWIGEAKRALKSDRMDTTFGKSESTHSVRSALMVSDEKIVPIIVVLTVRSRVTRGGKKDVRLFLTGVRAPNEDERSGPDPDGNAPWSDAFASEAWQSVVNALQEVTTAILQPPPTELRRGYLSFDGFRLDGEYHGAGWRLSEPQYPDPENPPIGMCEQMVACDREVAGRDAYEAIWALGHELDVLAAVLTVFWCGHVYRRNQLAKRWVLLPGGANEQVQPRLLQNGFFERSGPPPPILPRPNTVAGQVRAVDRLNPFDWNIVSARFAPPDDAMELLELFDQARRTDPGGAARFLAAAKAYQTSSFIRAETLTGSLAYLVVAAESLVESDLCPTCGSKLGLSMAMRILFFQELPCLRAQEDQVRRLLSEAYDIRSKHFHVGAFAGGELEPWSSVPILEPSHQPLTILALRMQALVNALLVAWLVKRVTNVVWPRALAPMPEWLDRPMRMFSGTVPAGPSTVDRPAPEALDDEAGTGEA